MLRACACRSLRVCPRWATLHPRPRPRHETPLIAHLSSVEGSVVEGQGEQPVFSKLDLRVGVITKVWAHPDADRLWCEEIDCGGPSHSRPPCLLPPPPLTLLLALLSLADPAEAPMVAEGAPRQIASGLRDWYTEEQMLGTRLVVLCNLKPRSLRGFK